MDAYETLRRQAAAKRDRIIELARRDFAETLARIAALRKQLGGAEPKQAKAQTEGAHRPDQRTAAARSAVHPGNGKWSNVCHRDSVVSQ